MTDRTTIKQLFKYYIEECKKQNIPPNGICKEYEQFAEEYLFRKTFEGEFQENEKTTG